MVIFFVKVITNFLMTIVTVFSTIFNPPKRGHFFGSLGTHFISSPLLDMSAGAAENSAAPEDFSPQAFLISVAATSFEERGFDPKTPYHRVFYMSPDGLWHFPAEEARRVVREVFGTDFSGFDGCYDFAYDSAADEYVSGLEFGGESAYSCRSISVAAADGGYSVSFELASSAAFESAAVYGKYTARFAAEKENDREFLRFEGITPANS